MIPDRKIEIHILKSQFRSLGNQVAAPLVTFFFQLVLSWSMGRCYNNGNPYSLQVSLKLTEYLVKKLQKQA